MGHAKFFMPQSQTQLQTLSNPTPLSRALDQNEIVRDNVEKSADELLLIHAVLKQEIPDHAQTGAVVKALEKTDALETKISDAAHELAQVNQVLAHEIEERVDLESELAATKAALQKAKSQH